MKRFGLALLLSCSLAACGTASLDPAQKALNTTVESCKSVGVAISALDAAVVSNSIKKSDAQKAAAGLVAANNGCAAALSALTPASGVK